MRIIINSKFFVLKEFLMSLPDTFDTLPAERLLRSGRNEVRLFTIGSQKIVVKSFRKI